MNPNPFPLISSLLYTAPWSILPGAHAELCRQFEAHVERREEIKTGREVIAAAAPRGAADDPVGPGWKDSQTGQKGYWHDQVEMMGSIAILRVRGIIGKHVSILGLWCGGCDAAIIAKQAENIAADDRVTHCVVLLDTPGGTCVGALECATAIRSMGKAGKVTIAYTDTQACSNGYFFASACDKIIAAPSAIVGSISTYCAALDSSRYYEMEGLERLVFRTGNVKGMGTPGKKWTDEEKAAMQQVTEDFGQQFKGFVRERRKLGEDLMQGQFWPAQMAPKGLVDGFADDLEKLLQAIAPDARF